MTATISPSRTDVLASRLAALRAERDLALAETVGEAGGDAADRATNVDANIRFSVLEDRIRALETELTSPSAGTAADGRVSVGDVVVLDLGDGPETFLVGSVEQAGSDFDVLTPSSPLGRAVLGAAAGDEISYRPRPGRTMTAKVVSTS